MVYSPPLFSLVVRFSLRNLEEHENKSHWFILLSHLNLLRWRSALLWRTFFTTAVVAVVLRAFIEYCRSGKCGLFGKGGLIMFDVNSSQNSYSTPDLLAVIFLGIIGGLLGSLYNFLVDKVLRTYSIINEYALNFSFTCGIRVHIQQMLVKILMKILTKIL